MQPSDLWRIINNQDAGDIEYIKTMPPASLDELIKEVNIMKQTTKLRDIRSGQKFWTGVSGNIYTKLSDGNSSLDLFGEINGNRNQDAEFYVLPELTSLIAVITRNYHAYGDNYIAMIRQYVDSLDRCDNCINGWVNLLENPLYKIHCPKCDGSGFLAKKNDEHA